ncbi:alternative oxidase [Amylostereum chailletii]|nr:alternative oxidase [Amylostereum chailletii]
MLGTGSLRFVSYCSSSRTSLLVSTARRSFTSCASRSNELQLKRPSQEAFPGTEGPHRNDATPTIAKSVDVKGDWVLFHPVYTPAELKAPEVLHHDAKNFSDWLAASFVKVARKSFDIVSGYKHKSIPPDSAMSLEQLRKEGYVMDEQAWLNRILFLESIAGVPGMVAATLRHLKSIRLMRRDSGWIHTLLEEAENERMHLMTFMTLRNPGIFFRVMILGAQGVFYNLFFLSYLVSPRTCHRFVGHLEEEAVLTYTRCIQDIEEGKFPEWKTLDAPEIAKDYWRLAPNATMADVVYAVRSDETTHRFVNHSLANLHQRDINPFALREPNMHVKGTRIEFDRDTAAKYVEESQKIMEEHQRPSSL